MTIATMFRPLADDEVCSHQMAAAEPWCPLTPVPPDAPALGNSTIMKWAKAGYALTSGWRYFDATGALLGFVVRFDSSADGADKDIVPITFCVGPGGRREWRKKSWDAPRPLYGLDRLAKQPNAPVLVVEGEKAADAAGTLFPDYVAITSPGGSTATGKADWSPLKERRIVIWPDNDEPGRKYADAIAKLASDAGAASVSIVELPAGFPPKWDLADAPPEGVAAAALVELVSAPRSTSTWAATDLRYLRPELPEPPVLPLDEVFSPGWVHWIQAAAEAKAAPPDYVLAAVLVVSASLIGNARWPSPWQGWAEPPILWSVIIGNPSANKSPGLDAVLLALKQAERRIREKDGTARADWKAKAEVAKLVESSWREEVKAAIKAGEEPPPRPDGADPGEEPVLARLVVSDTTIERLAVILSRQPRGTLLCRDELAGWLLGMNRYAGGGSDRPFWLESYGGRSYTVERMGREPVFVERLAVGVIGGIQPDRLRSLLVKVDDDGLLARLLPVWPHPAPIRRPSLFHDETFIENAISRLLNLQMPVDQDGSQRPWIIPFSDEARRLLDAFRQAVRDWESGAEGLLLSFIGKLPGMAVRLSLVLAYLKWASQEAADEPREIGVQDFGRAAHLAEAYFLPMARRSYADASAGPLERAARKLVAIIREEGWQQFSTRQLSRLNRPGLSNSDELNPILKLLQEADIIRPLDACGKAGRGRPARTFEVNPIIVEDDL